MALLELTDVVAYYNSVPALHGVTLQVEKGSIVAILGANGAGKTTTLRAISGMVKITGDVRLGDERLTGIPTEEVARRGVAHVPEGRGTLSQLTLRENLEMGACLRRDRSGIHEDLQKVHEYFPWMAKRGTQVAGLLSGGEQQMLAIARALMTRPKLLLLDEPSLGLAPTLVQTIFDIIKTINQEQGVTILLVEQNARTALRTADMAYVLEVGSIALSGSGEELGKDESVRRSYLGY